MRSLLIAGGLVLVLILALGIRLAVGPISLGFLKTEMETALNQRLPDYTTTLDDVVLVWGGWEEGVDLRALQISVLDGQGEALANIDQIAVGFAPGDLLVGRLAPDSLRIFSAHPKLLRREDGSLGFQAISSGQKSSAMLEFLLDSLLTDGGGESFSRLDEVSFAGATIDVEDVIARQDWQ